jgi:serine/threonine protein kinase
MSVTHKSRVQRLKRVNRICEQFEALYRDDTKRNDGKRNDTKRGAATETNNDREAVTPSIATFLEQVAEEERGDLFQELLWIELEYRRLRGSEAEPQEYHSQFPAYAELIETVFGDFQTDGQQDTEFLQRSEPSADETNLRWPSPNDCIGNYEIVEELGRGGMGVVYLATHVDSGRKTALKVIRPDRLIGLTAAAKQDVFERFRVESRAAAKLVHDNIVTLYEVGETDGFQFLSMQFVEGQSLRECVLDGPLESLRAARYLRQAASAVHALHQREILHRDLTPQNILISALDDRAVVSDFGLAKLTSSESLTMTGDVFGSPPYMSPEQATDATRTDEASDVYSLGATLYLALTGRPPFQAATATQTILQVVRDDALPVRKLNPDVDLDLETVCMKCLEKDPQRRYASAKELADELQRFERGEPVVARPLNFANRGMRWCRRNPLPAMLTTLLFLTLLAGTGISMMFAVEANGQAKQARQNATDFQNKEKEARLLAQQAKQHAMSAEQHAKSAEQQAELAKKSIANQLRLYARPCQVAGQVATARDAATALYALRQLGADKSSVMSQNVKLAVQRLTKLIEASPNEFQDHAIDHRLKMPIAHATMGLSIAARSTWKRECNSNYGSSRAGPPRVPAPKRLESLPTTVIELEQELLVQPLLLEIKRVVGELVQQEDWEKTEPLRIRFWELYWGESVLVENGEFRRLMTAMGEELSLGRISTPAESQRRQHIAQQLINWNLPLLLPSNRVSR